MTTTRTDDAMPNEGAILLTLRLVGIAPVAAVAERLEADEDVVLSMLEGLEARKLVRLWTGTLAGWKLTNEGQTAGEAFLAAELGPHRAAVDADYREFLPLNRQFLELCTDWQLSGPAGAKVLNDHQDAAYDAVVVARLAALQGQITPVLDRLAARLPRFGRYEERLTHALANVESGKQEWFTKPAMDSYHTIWFELHEDLLATLGYRRSDERNMNDRSN